MGYDYEKFDYSYLKVLYGKRFRNVYFVPWSRINRLYPFDKLFSLSVNNIEKYKKLIKKVPRENKSYSRSAVRLTFLKEAVFRKVRVKSLVSDDFTHHNNFLNSSNLQTSCRFKELLTKQKIRALFPRLVKRLFKPWRWWMQICFDRLYPYEKYNLPNDVLVRFDNKVMKGNVQFLADIESNIRAKD